MNTNCARRLLMAAIISTGLVSAAAAAEFEAPWSVPQATESGHALAAFEHAANATPDADANLPDAPNQLFSYYTVSGATLRGRSSTTETAYAGLGCSYLTAGSGIGLILNSDLPIPDGSLIKFLRIYYYDTNPANGVAAFLTSYAPGTASTDHTTVTSTDVFVGGYGTSLSPEISVLVDGDTRAYTVIGWPDATGSANRICGLRVAYYAPDFFADGFETPL